MPDEAREFPRLIKSYYGPQGERIEAMIACDLDTGNPIQEHLYNSKSGEPFTIYVGVVSAMTTVLSPSMEGNVMPGHVISESRFEIDAITLKEAFEKYEPTVRKIEEQMQEEQDKMIEEVHKNATRPELYVPNAVESKVINERQSPGGIIQP